MDKMKSLLAISLTLSACLVVVIFWLVLDKQPTAPPTVVVVTPAAATVVVTTAPPSPVTAPAQLKPLATAKVESRPPVATKPQAEEKALLQTELPPPLLVGTPLPPPKLPNLEPYEIYLAKRPDFFVPIGTTNLARGKRVTSSDSDPIIGRLDYITDGDKSADEGSWVELMPGKQWVQIDLENEAEIFAVMVWHYHAQRRAYLGVVVQISNDPAFTNAVTTIFNNDYANVQGFGVGTDQTYIESYQGKLIDAQGTKGRYVRLYSAGNHFNKLNHYIEVEVYGRPVYASTGGGEKAPLKTALPAYLSTE
jgi:hypothetical protein